MQTDLSSVVNRIITDFEFRTGQRANANQVIEAFIASYGGAAHALYRYMDNRLEQLFPATATGEWLALWGSRTGVSRTDGEVDQSYRDRIELVLQARNRFGRGEDLIAWGLAYDDIRFIYVMPNTPNFGYTTLTLGSDETLSDARKSEIRADISQQMYAGSMLMVAQSAQQQVDLTIAIKTEHRRRLKRALRDFIRNTNKVQGVEITIAQIHAQIDLVTNDYTLVTPVRKITALDSNHLALGVVTWQ